MNYPAPLKDGNAQSVIDIIEREMPGFKGNLNAKTDMLQWKGPFWMMGKVTMDWVMQVPGGREEVLAREIIERTQRDAIQRLGLQKVIDEEVRKAKEQGRRIGYSEGHASGIATGRREMLAEILAAKEEIDDPRD